jgi:hypothetical protein
MKNGWSKAVSAPTIDKDTNTTMNKTQRRYCNVLAIGTAFNLRFIDTSLRSNCTPV